MVKADTIMHGDCLDVLKRLPDATVHCIVTSPPYFGLRDYGAEGQLGLEPTPDEYVAALVAVLHEARRVLRNDGSLWLNLGDSYAGSGPSGASYQSETTKRRAEMKQEGNFRISKRLGERGLTYRDKKPVPPAGLKPKDLIGIPWRVAFALQADGWWLRSDIIWHKPNCMPESVRDRPTKSHEYVFLLTKSERYYYDADAVREPHTDIVSIARHKDVGRGRQGYARASGMHGRPQRDSSSGLGGHPAGRNRRDVWSVATAPYKGAHFAVMPPALVEPCVLAGCPVGGVVLDPFMGSGTVGVVARRHGRRYLGIELNADYIALAQERIDNERQPVLWSAAAAG